MCKCSEILDEMIKETQKNINDRHHTDTTWMNFDTCVSNILSLAKLKIQALWDGWILVTERKPKKMQEVDFSDWKNVWLWYYDGFTNSVTHWRERPLPPTPKQ